MEKNFSGIVSADGRLKIYEKSDFEAYCGKIKGSRVIISLITEDLNASIFSKIYFEKVICVHFLEIFKEKYGERTNTEIISERLRNWCPVTVKDGEIRPIEDLNQADMNELIKHSKFIAGSEFDYFIPD